MYKIEGQKASNCQYSIKEQVKADNDQVLKDKPKPTLCLDLGVRDLVLGFGI
jgi:hypothetical protein